MHVLVAYASKHGSTAEIAHAVTDTLRRSGLHADCLPADQVDDVARYDAVVLGSAVYMRRWRGDARRFLRRHARELDGLPFWVYSSGPTGPPAEDEARAAAWAEPRGTIAKAERLGARDHVVFGGRMPADPHGPAQKAMVDGCPPEYRDRRDWDEIATWAESVALALGAAAPTPAG
jgi:menaquinone-dependent protoporphyrinogen oxidase